MTDPIVIIGSGLAGITVARELRKLDKETPLIVVTGDDGVFYSKPNLSNALATGKSAAQLALTPAPQLASQLGIELRTHTRIERILPAEHRLESDGGKSTIPYRKLVLALGARPIRLTFGGDATAGVLAVNNLADYAEFRRHHAGKRRVAILGAGLIGCEFANDLRSAGSDGEVDVFVFDLAPQPLGRLLPPQSAAFFRDRLAAAGVNFHFATSIAEIAGNGTGYRLTDNHGASHDVDLVLSAVGLQAAVELAQAAGLTVNRGIVVDKSLRSSDPDIFALGDCAEVGGLLLPFVMPAMQAARALAKTLAAPDTAPNEVVYPAMPVVVKTPACPAVVCPPPLGASGAWREEADANGVRGIFETADGIALGFVLIGEAVKEKQALAAQMPAWL